MRTVSFTPRAFAEFTEWATLDSEVYRKIVRLIEDISRQPFTGLGKPEPLKVNSRVSGRDESHNSIGLYIRCKPMRLLYFRAKTITSHPAKDDLQ